MSTKFSQFNTGGLLLNSDKLVGLRTGTNYQFNVTGIGDSNGAPLLTWVQSTGPNVNYLTASNAITGAAPSIISQGTDVNVDMNITCQGSGLLVISGNNAVSIPSGTTGQRPAGPSQGWIRGNSSTGLLEFWNSVAAAWQGCASAAYEFVWNAVAVNTAMVPNNGYFCTGGGNLVFTLPTVCAAGQTMQVAGYLSTGWQISQNAGQQISFGALSSTVGTGGHISANTNPATDCVELVCVVANLEFAVITCIGNINVN